MVKFRAVKNCLETQLGSDWALFYQFSDPVDQFEIIPGFGVAVLTNPPASRRGPSTEQNIFFLTFQGILKWKVARAESLEDPYVHMKFENGKLYASAWSTNKYVVNLEDGSVTWCDFTK